MQKKLLLIMLFIWHVFVLKNFYIIEYWTNFNNWFVIPHDFIINLYFGISSISLILIIWYLIKPKYFTNLSIRLISTLWALLISTDAVMLIIRHEKISIYKEMSCEEYKVHLNTSDNKIYFIEAGGIACFADQVIKEYKQNYNINIIAVCEIGCFGAGSLSCKEEVMIEYLEKK